MRLVFRACIILGLAAILGGCQTVGGWFNRGDRVDDGPAPLVDFTPSIQAERVWSVNAGRGLGRSQPSLRPVYDRQEIWVADHRGRVTVMDADSGRQIKRLELDLPLSAGPTLDADRAYFGTFSGQLVVLDRDSGDILWRAQLSSEILSKPVVQDGVVIARCIDGRVFGLDRRTGNRLWVYDRSVPLLSLRGNSDPLGRAGQVFIGYDDGMVTALRAADGSVLWEQRVSVPEGRTELDRLADIDGPMAIVGAELYVVTYRGQMASLTLDAGRILWVKDVASHQGVSLQRTQLATADRDDAVWMVDRRNGTTLWRDDRLARRELTRPVFFGQHLVTVDRQGFMHWFNADSGELAARTRIGRNAPAGAPLVVGNMLYVMDVDGGLTAWRVRS
ncbi:MAG: outer membrane protein assembly factor BamB [Wenzhouxiangella sp.]